VHFLAAVELDAAWMIVDPFHDGRELAREEVFDRLEQLAGGPLHRSDELLATATHRDWLARIVRNLEQVFQRTARQIDMLAMRELLELVSAEFNDA
jgi:regulator of sirC expression with transglutaminase-like and TPR domain